MGAQNRDVGIDVWRGLALITIFVNHVPGNPLERLTHRNLGFSDSAEGFVFLAGFVLFLACRKALARGDGLRAMAGRCWRRAGRLYVVHAGITAAALGIFALALLAGVESGFVLARGRDVLFADPLPVGLAMAGLLHQIDFFDILPLYIALLLMAPVMLVLASRRPFLLVLLSGLVYAGARLLHLHPPTWPIGGGWFFNPLAWQLVFALGIASAALGARLPLLHSRAAFAAACAVLLAGLVVATDGLGARPGLAGEAWARLDVDKTELGLARLAHFLCLAFVLARLGLGRRLGRLKAAAPVIALGREGLFAFAAGSIIGAVCQVTIAGAGGSVHVSLVTMLAGLTAYLLCVPAKHWLETLASHSSRSSSPVAAAS